MASRSFCNTIPLATWKTLIRVSVTRIIDVVFFKFFDGPQAAKRQEQLCYFYEHFGVSCSSTRHAGATESGAYPSRPLASRRRALRSHRRMGRIPLRETSIRQHTFRRPSWTTLGLTAIPLRTSPGSVGPAIGMPHRKPPCWPPASRRGPASSRPQAVLKSPDPVSFLKNRSA